MAERTAVQTRSSRSGKDLALSGLAAVLERVPRTRPSLAVLTYHRVAPAAERPDLHDGLRIEPDAFAQQVELVARRATPVSIDDVRAAAAGRTDLPPRAVHLTFDDAYADIEEHAWPVLRRVGIPATMFVPTAYPDQDRSFWWDRLSHAVHATPAAELEADGERWAIGSGTQRLATFVALRARIAGLPHDEAMRLVDEVEASAESQGATANRPATSSWDGLRTMAAEGLALGAHTRHHPFLDRVTTERLESEVVGSLEDLRREVGDHAQPVLAYPSGAHDDSVVAATAGLGIEAAFTTERGVLDLTDADWLRIPRINVGRRASAALVRIQLTPGSHAARALARSALDRARTGRSPHNGRNSWS
ncbi:N/A [soil metagenome]